MIPVLDEEKNILATVAAVGSLNPDELLVVDGGSTDDTLNICNQLGVTVILSERGRSAQMNVGAKHSTGDVLLFFHADTSLPGSAFSDIRSALSDPRCVGGRFDLELDGEQLMLRVIGKMISLRSRLTRIGTGDQAIFVRRHIFETISGYPKIPLMEDIAFSRAMKH